MQPPPRKGSSVKFLKTLHAEQIAKLQVKNQTECELLEDLRSFILKKSALEKSYCEALLKITSVYLNKKITTSIPDLKTEGSDERWNMWSVWRTVLEENEKLSRTRLAALEVLSQQIADDSKILRIYKLQTTKKCVDLLASIQKEVQNTVQDVEKTKKVYFDEEHCAHDVRDKAKDIEARLKRKKGSFFQSLSTLQKSSAKVSLKREQMDDKSVGARNDYLLSLATANAHQTRYFVNDLQNIMQIMESGVYEKVQQYFCVIGRAELLTCSARQASYSKIRDQSQKLTREYNLQCLFLYYPVLKQHIQYEFEACDGDNIDYITSGSATTALQFIEEVKDWLEIVSREKSAIRINTKKIKYLYSLREHGEKSDPDDPSGPDIDTKLDELHEAIRKSEVMKVKTESKIELLKKSQDDNVRDMCKKLEEELGSNMEEEEEEEEEKEKMQPLQRTSVNDYVNEEAEERNYSSEEDTSYPQVEQNISTDDDTGMTTSAYTHKTSSQPGDVLKHLEASWDTADDTTTSSYTLPESSSHNIYNPDEDNVPNVSYEEFETPFKCVVLYNYTAQNSDELTITAGEELKILGEGDGDGWLRARNNSGEEGFVPCTYLESYTVGEEEIVDHDENGVAVSGGQHLTSQISFSSVDYTVTTSIPAKSIIGGDSVVSGDSSASVVTAVQELDSDKAYEDVDGAYNDGEDSEYCIALYDYEASGEDELTFHEGQVIHVIRKIVHDGIDDGWWEGEVDGRIGIFPSLMVETCHEDGRSYDDDVEHTSAPPLFTPPEVPGYALTESYVNATDSGQQSTGQETDTFSFEMSDNQQKQYNTQFDDDSENAKTETIQKSNTEFRCKVIESSRVVYEEDGGGGEEEKREDTSDLAGSALADISINIVGEDGITQGPNTPDSINVIQEDDCDSQPDEDVENSDYNLGVTQIVITAPTPSSDAADKAFPPDPAPDDSQMSVAAVLLERRKSAGEINEADPPLYDASLINDCVDYPTTIIEEPEEEEEEEEKYNEECKLAKSSSEANDPAERRCSAIGGSTPSSTYPQYVPEQLEPHQLQRLQQLKESNA